MLPQIRHDWTREEVLTLFEKPLLDLLFQAQTIHRQCFTPNTVQLSTLLSIKTGACPEDCAYCPQSGHYHTDLPKERLLDAARVVQTAQQAKANGATRFCMGAAWKSPPKKDFEKVVEILQAVKDLGMETCLTMGTLDETQCKRLKAAGLDYYNHNLDTSPEYYPSIITTRTYQDRLDTLKNVREAGLKSCCGGIIGMGETRADRAGLLVELANLPEHPHSVPINRLVAVKGTPLAERLTQNAHIDGLEFVRTIASARMMMPHSVVRLSAGRENMSDELQTLCFLAGANSIFYGEQLLTVHNATMEHDQHLFAQLGLRGYPLDDEQDCEIAVTH